MQNKRGRKSRAELAVTQTNLIEIAPRPTAPEELTDEQAVEWDAVVSRMASDWFPRETHGLLAQYCRHVVAARRIGQMIEVFESGDDQDLERYDKLLKMQEREGRALSSLATRMRLSQQTIHDREKKKDKVKGGKKLWES